MLVPDFDVIIVGAGVAGLAATAKLADSGLHVLCIEARDYLGGRIHTLHDPDAPIPIELGAEFIHGRPPEIWELAGSAGLIIYECAEAARHIRNGKLQQDNASWQHIDMVMEDMQRAAKERDEPFSAFLERSSYPKEVKQLAAQYVEGFNAARKEVVGIRSLATDARASDAIDGGRSFRLLNGYDSVPREIWRTVSKNRAQLRLNTILKQVDWRAGRVKLHCVNALTSEALTYSARRAVFTLPLGVLQGSAIGWSPAPQINLEAARALAFGHVMRLVFRFREAFWEKKRAFGDAGFLLSNEDLFPTWWTTLPLRTPILTGWSAGPHADVLLGKSRSEIIQSALQSLSRILHTKLNQLSDLVEAVYFHDWQADPFACGAYSYVPANLKTAREHLAAPVEDTLFFAGEATDTAGHSATVHGAIATGMRVAEAIAQASKSPRPRTRARNKAP